MTRQSTSTKTSLRSGCLEWFDDLGYGKHSAPPIDYNDGYFDNYLALDKTKMGVDLTAARVDFVTKYSRHKPIDIGIGGGIFCKEMNCNGFDISTESVRWLIDNNKYIDPYSARVESITCWDSLEHIPDIGALLSQVKQWVFCSIPIFENEAHCLKSKHYKPGEHIWYFTHEGLERFMIGHGFKLYEYNNKEVVLGREGVRTYAFNRAPQNA